jgi:hypothetical protein
VAVTIKIGGLRNAAGDLDFIPLTNKAEIVRAAYDRARVFDDIKVRTRVLDRAARHRRNDSAPTSMTDVPFDLWREVNVDGVAVGTIRECRAGGRHRVRRAASMSRCGSSASTRARRFTVARGKA